MRLGQCLSVRELSINVGDHEGKGQGAFGAKRVACTKPSSCEAMPALFRDDGTSLTFLLSWPHRLSRNLASRSPLLAVCRSPVSSTITAVASLAPCRSARCRA